MTVAQTLSVVHGLVGNVKVVMEGTQRLYDLWASLAEHLFRQMERRQLIVSDRT